MQILDEGNAGRSYYGFIPETVSPEKRIEPAMAINQPAGPLPNANVIRIWE